MANPVNAIDPDGLCVFRMLGGIADIGTGLLLTAKTGGIGLVVAWALIINGADNLVAGAYSMTAGEEIPSLIQGGFRRAIPNRTAADLAYMGFEIGLNVAGLAVERAAIRVAQVASSGDPVRISLAGGKLSSRQNKLLEQLPEIGSEIIVHKKAVSLKDIAALTAETGDEFALLTRGSQRMIIRGNYKSLPTLSVSRAARLAAKGWKWSGHVHPGITPSSIYLSGGDEAVLEAFQQARHLVLNSTGRFKWFDITQP